MAKNGVHDFMPAHVFLLYLCILNLLFFNNNILFLLTGEIYDFSVGGVNGAA